jgi:hypothetical protein
VRFPAQIEGAEVGPLGAVHELLTVTVTPADVVWLPAVSVATAVSTRAPLATDDVIHDTP